MVSRSDALYSAIECDLASQSYSTTAAFAANCLLDNVLSKYLDTSDSADKAALQKFKGMNHRAEEYSARIRTGDFVYPTTGYVLELVRYNLARAFNGVDGVVDVHAIHEGIDVGNGSNVKGYTNSFLGKVFCGPLTCSDIRLYRLYTLGLHSFTWKLGEQVRFAKYGIDVVPGSSLSFVPKNRKISRVICTEPTVNMLLQKGISSIISKVLRTQLGIDMSTQPEKNKLLAQKYSVSNAGFTLDLSSASDMITMGLLEAILPDSLLKWIKLTRTPNAIFGEEVIPLHMVSTMGNGYTSTLQTLVFSALMQACYDLLGIPGKGIAFGDDMLGKNEIFSLLRNTLTDLGFLVNEDKTFSDGPFRESCGGDYFNGTDVRPVFIRALDKPIDVYKAFNSLARWSARSNVDLHLTLYTLSTWAPKLRVPPSEADDAGFHSSVPPRKHVVLTNWCRTYPYIAMVKRNKVLDVFSARLLSPGIVQALIRGDVTNDKIMVRDERLKFVYDRVPRSQPIGWLHGALHPEATTHRWEAIVSVLG